MVSQIALLGWILSNKESLISLAMKRKYKFQKIIYKGSIAEIAASLVAILATSLRVIKIKIQTKCVNFIIILSL